ncbi:MAG: outer membrane lipoprotein chaperone LolA [Gammaproteobacteria bacterium]|nr:outer membrane lipoprotein chaperone LolA [Gammaproteobacteria bacterium]
MRLAAFVLSITIATSSWAQTAAQSLGQQLGQQSNIEADFVQYILDASGSRLQETHGHMVLAAPNKFWWKTEDPFAQLLVSNGKQLWVYDADLEQVTVQTLDQKTTNTPALLLSGNGNNIDTEFNVVMKRAEGGLVYYRLTPKDPASLYQILRLNFKHNQLLEMQLEDTMQQKTSLSFKNMVFNPALADGLFEFVIPPDTDVINMDPL